MVIKKFCLIYPKIIKKENKAFYDSDKQEEFSKELGNARRNKINVMPYVIVEDPTSKTGNRWIKYRDYKKLKKEE